MTTHTLTSPVAGPQAASPTTFGPIHHPIHNSSSSAEPCTSAARTPLAMFLNPFSIFNSGAYGGGDCSKSDCNGITMNGGSLTMTGVEVRNNQVSCARFPHLQPRFELHIVCRAEVFGCRMRVSALCRCPCSLIGRVLRHTHSPAAHRAQNFSERHCRYRNHRAACQWLHDHVLLRVPEQNCDSVGPAESGCKQPVQVKQFASSRCSARGKLSTIRHELQCFIHRTLMELHMPVGRCNNKP